MKTIDLHGTVVGYKRFKDLVELYFDGKLQNNFEPKSLCGFENFVVKRGILES